MHVCVYVCVCSWVWTWKSWRKLRRMLVWGTEDWDGWRVF